MGEHELLSGANNGSQQQQQQHQNSQNPNPLVSIQTASSITNDNNSLASTPVPKSQNSSAINVNSIINGNINAGLYIVCYFILNSYVSMICVISYTYTATYYMLHVITYNSVLFLFIFPFGIN